MNIEQVGFIKLFPHSIELLLGGKKLALCHFANDVRCDFNRTNYHDNFKYPDAYKQFLYNNSESQKQEIDDIISRRGDMDFMNGYISAQNEPLFKALFFVGNKKRVVQDGNVL